MSNVTPDFSSEQWKPIPGFPNHAVSDMGRVKRIAAGKGTFTGRIFQGYIHSSGYQIATLDQQSKRVHRLVMLAFSGECPEGMEVNHKNGNKTDNRLENLEYIDRSENNRHAFTIGLKTVQGEANPRSKLTESDVREIRALEGSMTHREIAERFGVHRVTVSSIFSRKLWGHVE